VPNLCSEEHDHQIRAAEGAATWGGVTETDDLSEWPFVLTPYLSNVGPRICGELLKSIEMRWLAASCTGRLQWQWNVS
jgi:hypothetical protein